jgi:tetratricopeptide (TPR) repeat protein
MRLKRQNLLGAVLGLFIAQGALQVGVIHRNWEKFQPKDMSLSNDLLSPDQILLNLFGFREFLASILWVRADGFFDAGNYDAVLPMINLCTLLDPHQIDIYSTGMWHIAYNFTDEEQRSDRRYVPSALALGRRGVRNNPDTYEIFFESGWIWYHKIDDDYFQAVKWFQEAHERPDIIPGRRNLLANAYQRNGELDKALQLYYDLLSTAQKEYDANPREFSNFQMRDTIENNLDTMIVRLVQRGTFAQQRGDFAQGNYDTRDPWDVKFSVRVSVDSPKVVRVDGTWNVLPVGTRVRLIIRDKDTATDRLAELDWDGKSDVDLDPSRTTTFLQDQLFVKNRRFSRVIDMTKDPTMYPFSEDHKEYLVEFYYNPRSAPPHIQDKFGFLGEGFTDKNYLSTSIRKNYQYDISEKDSKGYSVNPKLTEAKGEGQRVVYCAFTLTRDQILRRGEWSMEGGKVPLFTSKGFDPRNVASVDEQIYDIPALRGEAPKTGAPSSTTMPVQSK